MNKIIDFGLGILLLLIHLFFITFFVLSGLNMLGIFVNPFEYKYYLAVVYFFLAVLFAFPLIKTLKSFFTEGGI